MGLEGHHRELLRGIRRAAVLRGLLVHILVFLTGMIILNLTDASLERAPIVTGWLIGLALHGATAAGLGQYIGEEWEERRFEDILRSRQDRHEMLAGSSDDRRRNPLSVVEQSGMVAPAPVCSHHDVASDR